METELEADLVELLDVLPVMTEDYIEELHRDMAALFQIPVKLLSAPAFVPSYTTPASIGEATLGAMLDKEITLFAHEVGRLSKRVFLRLNRKAPRGLGIRRMLMRPLDRRPRPSRGYRRSVRRAKMVMRYQC